ncbi:YcaO-like family protein [Mediterraneibacter gnavus]|uniref:YcaO domain-containing protein n=1 Tax=Mediterraneibacter gnavus TaxID=33038 RepID=A0AB36DJW6_MEDGN|nr:YcaO-like family protein [Mediterraneibacter gnavus]NSI66530.1 hypothetical protein [Mediterraneibacter gnavus]
MEKGLNIADFTLLSSIIQDNRIEGIYKSECDFISSPVFFIKRRDEYNNLVCDCGKGLTVQNAFLSAFYEMLERCSAEKFEGRSFAMVEGEKHNLISESFERYGIRRVCSGKNILNGSFVTLSLDAVKFPPELGGGFNGTIGLASGVSFEDAVIHAIFEILEHDTISLFLNTGLPCYLIEIDDRQKELFDIRRAAESKGVKCTVRLLTSPFNVYPVLVTYENMPGFENYKVAGIGCSLDPVMATRRALTECEQSAALWFEKYKNCDMEEGEIYHPTFNLEYPFTFNEKTIKLSDIPVIETENELEYLKKELAIAVNEIIVVDISRQELHTHCVKVLIPELEFALNPDAQYNNVKRVNTIKNLINQCVVIGE